MGSAPAMAFSMMAVSSTVRHMGPILSMVQLRGMTPARLTLPLEGRMPDMPFQEAGNRMEPPVSEPRAPKQRPAETPTPDPLLEPAGA